VGWRLKKGFARGIFRRQLVLFFAEILGTQDAAVLKCPQIGHKP
jgi:hypothetical protein